MATTAIRLRFHHYKHVYWTIEDGPFGSAYTPVVVHDGCTGCLVCGRTTAWFMEFARAVHQLVGTNLRDCLHWGHLQDNPQPLIVASSNLRLFNRKTLVEIREAYYALPEARRPTLERVFSHDRGLSQSQRFGDRLKILERMVELWEDGEYIGWPS